MTDVFISNETIQSAYQLQPGKTFEEEFSKASIESILFYAIAFCTWFLETIFDTLTTDTHNYIATMKPHSLKWYANKALAYQHGFALHTDSDAFNNTGKTAEEIEESKVVKHAAVTEHVNAYGRPYLRVKVAGEENEDLAPLSPAQLSGVKGFFDRIKDAGVLINVESKAPDAIKMSWKIFFDPLLLDANGNRLDGSATDVGRAAIKQYLQRLPFNGIYALQKHEDFVQQVDGVVLCPIQSATTKQAGWAEFQPVGTLITPNAGYLRFENDADLIIDYIPQSQLV